MTTVSLTEDSLRARPGTGTWTVKLRGQGYQRYVVISSKVNLYYFWEKRWFFVAMAVGYFMLQLPLPEGLSRDGMIVMAMSVMATIMFVTEPVPLPTVALLIIVGQVLLLGLDSNEVAATLMTDSVLFIMGSLMLAVAVVKQKLDKRIENGRASCGERG